MPKSRNRKGQKTKAKHRTEEVKKQQTAFKNRLMEQFKQKQLVLTVKVREKLSVKNVRLVLARVWFMIP